MADRLVATGAATTVTVVELDLVASSVEVAVMVTVWAAAGAVQVEPDQVPAVEDQATVLFAPPVAVELKARLAPTVLVWPAGVTAPTETTWGVTVTVLVAVAPAALVTVRV